MKIEINTELKEIYIEDAISQDLIELLKHYPDYTVMSIITMVDYEVINEGIPALEPIKIDSPDIEWPFNNYPIYPGIVPIFPDWMQVPYCGTIEAGEHNCCTVTNKDFKQNSSGTFYITPDHNTLTNKNIN